MLSSFFIQTLNGLASASTLFLVAVGLFVAYSLIERLGVTPLGFWGGVLGAALAVAVVGALIEMLILRRIYHAPELFQLLATFGLTLMVEDLVVLIWGPDDLVGRRAPGFKGAIDFFGQNIPRSSLPTSSPRQARTA